MLFLACYIVLKYHECIYVCEMEGNGRHDWKERLLLKLNEKFCYNLDKNAYVKILIKVWGVY